MEITDFAIGTDIEETKRFENKTLEKNEKFLKRIFTQTELEYSFKDKCSHQHLAARFCAKEAVVKALYSMGIEKVTYSEIEVINEKNGVPRVFIKPYPEIKVKVSLSHSKTNAVAMVLLYR